MDFWDTAGQERFNNLHPSYFYRAHACVMAFDVTRKVRRVNCIRTRSHNRPIVSATRRRSSFGFIHALPLSHTGNIQEPGQMVQRTWGVLPWNTDHCCGQQNRRWDSTVFLGLLHNHATIAKSYLTPLPIADLRFLSMSCDLQLTIGWRKGVLRFLRGATFHFSSSRRRMEPTSWRCFSKQSCWVCNTRRIRAMII